MARRWAGKSQEEWAQLTGISRGTIAAYEGDERERLPRPYVVAWAQVAGVSVEWLMTGEDDAAGPFP